MRRGFTLVELTFVLTVLGILVAATVPTYGLLVNRARADEARVMLQAIAHAELRAHRDQGRFLACADDRPVPRAPTAFPNELACWRALGIAVDGPVRYRYRVVAESPLRSGNAGGAPAGGSESFAVVAEGDLDGDGVSSRFTLEGRTLELTVEDELE